MTDGIAGDRLDKLKALREAGVDPFPARVPGAQTLPFRPRRERASRRASGGGEVAGRGVARARGASPGRLGGTSRRGQGPEHRARRAKATVSNETRKRLSEYVGDMAREESNQGLPSLAERGAARMLPRIIPIEGRETEQR